MWHRCPVRLPSPHLEIESIGKVCLKQMGGEKQGFQCMFSLQNQTLLKCTGTLSMHFPNWYWQQKSYWWHLWFVTTWMMGHQLFVSLFQVLQWLFPTRTCHTTWRDWPGRCIQGSCLKSVPYPPCLLLLLCPSVFVELGGNGSPGSQHHPNLGCASSSCSEGLQQEVCYRNSRFSWCRYASAADCSGVGWGSLWKVKRQSFYFVFLPVVPLPRVCDLWVPLAQLLHCSYISVQCFQVTWSVGWWPSFISRG